MTTNVFDGENGILAADTRWSYQSGNWLFYIDEPHFPKIEVLNKQFAFMFAGDGGVIQNWKSWIKSAPNSFESMPDSHGVAVCIVDLPSGKSIYSEHQEISLENDVHFTGSGARFAVVCWKERKCAKTAILSASKSDKATGSECQFYNVSSHETNINIPFGVQEITIQDVSRNIAERGRVMNTLLGTQTEFKLSNLVTGGEMDLNIDAIKEVQAKLASGEKLPIAPCNSMYDERTPEQDTKLKEALSKVFGMPIKA